MLSIHWDTHKSGFCSINLRQIWVFPIPPRPCKRKDFLWPPILEPKWDFSLCKYWSRPVNKILGCFRLGRGGREAFSEVGWLHWFIYEGSWLAFTYSTYKVFRFKNLSELYLATYDVEIMGPSKKASWHLLVLPCWWNIEESVIMMGMIITCDCAVDVGMLW